MSNSQNFKGKVALVTGSSSGIGAETAILFAQFGGQVVITGRNKEKLQKVFDQCKKAGQEGTFKTANPVIQLVGDINDVEFCKKLVESTVNNFGKIDILVNNAGFGKPISIYDPNYLKNFTEMFNTNVKSVVAMSQLVIPYLEKTKGVIVNVSSMGSIRPFSPLMGIYCMTKAALDMFTKSLALEVGPKGIRVNSINPGPVKTDFHETNMTPELRQKYYDQIAQNITLRRPGESDDIAKHIAFLSSEDSSFITGTCLLADGGAIWSLPSLKRQ